MLANLRYSLLPVVQQHADESAVLRTMRTQLVSAPHVKLHLLRRLDDRLAAHLDGLAVAGRSGWTLCESALEHPGVGEVFTATVRAIQDKHSESLEKLLSLAEAVPAAQSGLVSAFGWVSGESLRGTASALLSHPEPFRKLVGIAACALHRVDPGSALDEALITPDARLLARALRCAGEVGRRAVLRSCVEHLKHEDAHCRFRAAASAVLLGDRDAAWVVLEETAQQVGVFRNQALALALFSAGGAKSVDSIRHLVSQGEDTRTLVRAVAYSGDATSVPWLIRQMGDDKLCRVAGESFSMITGVDLAALDLERKPPETVEAVPNDNPDDSDVATDEDDGLPWSDPPRVAAWWRANEHRFQPGIRYFMGEPPTPANCVSVLKTGFQRQRIAAAQYLCLLKPGTPLFNTSAPAWRQQRLLASMS